MLPTLLDVAKLRYWVEKRWVNANKIYSFYIFIVNSTQLKNLN